jgi:hypothetical protein
MTVVDDTTHPPVLIIPKSDPKGKGHKAKTADAQTTPSETRPLDDRQPSPRKEADLLFFRHEEPPDEPERATKGEKPVERKVEGRGLAAECVEEDELGEGGKVEYIHAASDGSVASEVVPAEESERVKAEQAREREEEAEEPKEAVAAARGAEGAAVEHAEERQEDVTAGHARDEAANEEGRDQEEGTAA